METESRLSAVAAGVVVLVAGALWLCATLPDAAARSGGASAAEPRLCLPLVQLRHTFLQRIELIRNGGFESGSFVWVEESSDGLYLVNNAVARTGEWSAWLGGRNNAADVLHQTVGVPAEAVAARLQFYLYVASDEPVAEPHDFLYVQLRDTAGVPLESVRQVDNTSAGSGWCLVAHEWDVFTPYAGTELQLAFCALTDAVHVTDFIVDDVSFLVS